MLEELIKEELFLNGIHAAATGFPRSIVKEAYNEDVAYGIIRNAKEKYVEMFDTLRHEIKTNWF